MTHILPIFADRIRQALQILALLSVLLLGTTSQVNASVPWNGESFEQQLTQGFLGQLLKDFCASQGVQVEVSEDLSERRLSGLFENSNGSDGFWRQLSKDNNLSWFYDGSVMRVESRASVSQMIIGPEDRMDRSAVEQFARELGYDGNFVMHKDISVGSQSFLILAGPPSFMEAISSLRKAMGRKEGFAKDSFIRMFPLENAWANDVPLALAGSEVTVPGVATLLRQVIDPSNSSQRGSSSSRITQPRNRPNFSGARKMLGNLGFMGGSDDEQQQGGTSLAEPLPVPENPNDAPIGSIIGIPQLNAVIVRDLAHREAIYEDLIAQLDIPLEVIELRAQILDINVNHTRDLGIDSITGALTDNGDPINLNYSNTQQSGAEDSSEGAAFFSALGNLQGSAILNAQQVISQVRMLVTNGHASVVSQPSVVTLDNIEATISTEETFYARITGERVADLFEVSAGVTLRVIPNISSGRNGSGKDVRMLVSIEDGSIGNALVDGLPTKSSSNIRTQAVVPIGKSLVLGGYFRKSVSHNQSGVPLLKSIPLVGRVFRVDAKEEKLLQRIFVLTPTLANPFTGNAHPNLNDMGPALQYTPGLDEIIPPFEQLTKGVPGIDSEADIVHRREETLYDRGLVANYRDSKRIRSDNRRLSERALRARGQLTQEVRPINRKQARRINRLSSDRKLQRRPARLVVPDRGKGHRSNQRSSWERAPSRAPQQSKADPAQENNRSWGLFSRPKRNQKVSSVKERIAGRTAPRSTNSLAPKSSVVRKVARPQDGTVSSFWKPRARAASSSAPLPPTAAPSAAAPAAPNLLEAAERTLAEEAESTSWDIDSLRPSTTERMRNISRKNALQKAANSGITILEN